MTANPTPTSPTRARPIFWLAIVLLLAVVVELTAYLVEALSPRLLSEPIRRRSVILREQSERLALLLDTSRVRREMLDPLLGWRYRPGHVSDTDHLNSWGVRAQREYDRAPAAGTFRVAAFGDSFVYGNEVSDADAWTAVLERASPGTEVLNFGVGGYGLDQAYLLYQSAGRDANADLVLIGFTPDDLRRAVNVYRRFISTLEWPLTKPRFAVREGGRLDLLPNPAPDRAALERLLREPEHVRALGAHDAWYAPTIYENPLYDRCATLRVAHAAWMRIDRQFLDSRRLLRGGVFNPRSEAFGLHVVLLDEFATRARANAESVVLMLPDRASVERLRAGALPAYATLRDSLESRGVAVWDAGEALQADGPGIASLFAPGGHYSPTGNRVVAEWLRARVDSVRAGATIARTGSSP